MFCGACEQKSIEKMREFLFLLLFISSLACSHTALSQVGIGTAVPAASAAVDVVSTTKGMLLPRMTAAQRSGIVSPVQGLLVFQTDGDAGFYYHTGVEWVSLSTGLAPNTTGLARPLTVTTFYQLGSYGSGNGPGVFVGSSLYYITQNTVVKITGSSFMTLAGSIGASGSADGTGSAARFSAPSMITAAPDGTVYVFDKGAIRKITASGVVSTLAGTVGVYGQTDGTGTAAQFFIICGSLAVDAAGVVYVGELTNTLRKVTPSGVVSTLAGLANSDGSADGTGAAARFYRIVGLAVDAGGVVYAADQNNTIRKITPAGVVTTLAGAASGTGFSDGTGAAARFASPSGLAFGPDGALYVGDNTTLRRITTTGTVTTLAGFPDSRIYINGPVPQARFAGGPLVIGVGSDGAVYVIDISSNDIRVIK